MAIAFSIPAMAASAQTGVDVGGYVAPRCWSVPAANPLAAPTVRCNTMDPQLSFRSREATLIRASSAGQSLRTSDLPAWAQREGLSVPAPIEVIVSPNL